MWQAVLGDARLYEVLVEMDEDLAAQARAEGCPHCGSRLHSARYPRKPRGLPSGAPEEPFATRRSFCCAVCRRRTTPASVRFLGRRVYVSAVVLLATAFAGPLSRRRVATLRERLGVTERTLRRWRDWWRGAFVQTAFWRMARPGFVPAIEVRALPQALLDRFTGDDVTGRVVRALGFLSPLSTHAG